MIGERDRELTSRLRELRAPDEEAAEERSWEVVREAYAERRPVRPTYRTRRLAIALAGGALVVAVGLSPAGAKVGDLVSHVVGISGEEAKPALRSLPAAGELLVESEQGPWIVRADGSKRLLGDYESASWSPNGFYVVAAEGRELLAVDPDGEVQWTIDAPAPTDDPRWGGTEVDTRIAYRSGEDLWVVDGDGTGERQLAEDVAPVAPAWRPFDPESKVTTGAAPVHVLAYVDGEGRVRAVDVDSGARQPVTDADFARLSVPPEGGKPIDGALSPDGLALARIERAGNRDELSIQRSGEAGNRRVLFAAVGHLTGPTWSPDGRWLLVGWREADQWVFIRADRQHRIVAVDAISSQFDPGGTGEAGFPRVSGWILPAR